MLELSGLSVLLGAAIAAAGVACFVEPVRTASFLSRFPRSKWPAWILTAVSLAWAGLLLWQTPLGRFEAQKPLLFLLVPVAFFLIVRYMDELLAPRALGGLLLLIPAPLLRAAQWDGSAFKFVVIALAYAFVVLGSALVLSPYLFRRGASACLGEQNRRCRACGVVLLCVGVVLVLLGLTAYSSRASIAASGRAPSSISRS